LFFSSASPPLLFVRLLLSSNDSLAIQPIHLQFPSTNRPIMRLCIPVMRIILVCSLALLALAENTEELPAHLTDFVARLKEEIATTAQKYSDPRERATRILATHVSLLSQLSIPDRRLLNSFFDGNSLLEVVDPLNYRSEAIHRTPTTSH
ncbi:hypothetical protein PENTCL1PPCAC_27486, partial [Pristionchus entomophagus]